MNKEKIQEELRRKSIEDDLKIKRVFITYLHNSIFLLIDAIDRENEEDIRKYKKWALKAINGIIKNNDYSYLKNQDTREEDAKLRILEKAVKDERSDIAELYNKLPKSLRP